MLTCAVTRHDEMLHLFICLIGLVQCIPLEDIDLGHCGKMAITFESQARGTNGENEVDYEDDVRIVGGFDAPEPVPWFVMLKIATRNGTAEGLQCGASLITPK